MAHAVAIDLHALGAESASGAGSSKDIGELSTALKLTLTVSAVSGEFKPVIETSPDGASSWRTVGVFLTVEAAPFVQQLCFDRLDRFARVGWTLSAGGSATFGLSGNAHQLYAKREDLGAAMPEDAFERAKLSIRIDNLIKASCEVEDAFRASNALPLTKWPESLTHKCAQIAAFYVLTSYGFAGGGIDELVAKAFDQAQAWLKSIMKREVKPANTSPDADSDTRTSSGDPRRPQELNPRFSDNFGDF